MPEYKLLLLPSAKDDIHKARDWYKQHGSDLAVKFIEQVRSSMQKVKANPFAYGVRYKRVHIANLQVFPYAVHFIVERDANTVIILGLFHTAMSPDKWERL